MQEQSKTFNYLTKNGLLDSAKLDQDLADLSAAYQQSKAELKATEKRLKDVNRQLRLLGQYFRTKAVYREYLKGGKILRQPTGLNWNCMMRWSKNCGNCLGIRSCPPCSP